MVILANFLITSYLKTIYVITNKATVPDVIGVLIWTYISNNVSVECVWRMGLGARESYAVKGYYRIQVIKHAMNNKTGDF